MSSSDSLQQFKNLVGIKFQLYNSLFTSLPFHKIEKTGILLSMLLMQCDEGYEKYLSPEEIIENFFSTQTALGSEEDKLDILFRFVQYMERQVVLFDALEDAAFTHVHDVNGKGTIKALALEIEQQKKESELKEKLKSFSVEIVLTAHPTQFYRGAVLGIINDLTKAVSVNNENNIYSYLQQLGRTPFFQPEKPTPFDEASILIWYLRNVFYHAAGKIVAAMKDSFGDAVNASNQIIKMGFWPGGDRDGNPFVKAATTLQVANTLKDAILKSYHFDVIKLKRRLTFKAVDTALAALDKKLHNSLYNPIVSSEMNANILLTCLENIRNQLLHNHNSLFIEPVEELINKIEIFGMHFASLDVRQESSVHGKLLHAVAENSNVFPNNYATLSSLEKIEIITRISQTIDGNILSDELHKDALEVVKVIKTIQQTNGELGCNRYIISQCQSALNAMEVIGIFLLAGWKPEEITVDIVPLFETVVDLQSAAETMRTLYENTFYKKHLKQRKNKQTIMLGFSDGTKDGGYLMANWSIYKAKEALSAIAKQYEIDVVFFDGRGGPPARGGGKTNQFYASMGKNISNREIQLTVQGQTVSSNFGTIISAKYNIEQLLHAGISNGLLTEDKITLQTNEEELLQQLANASYESYTALKEHPNFIDYLSNASPLRFYAETNIGSRPSKRGGSNKLELKDLRAIPFVGAWSQIKQNVSGYYGVGTAIEKLEKQGNGAALKALYNSSLFFKTLLDNCEMAMAKCFFPLTAFLQNHPVYGEIWTMLHDEFELTKKHITGLSGNTTLMENYPVDQLSIQMREKIVLPLVTIQQYALTKVRIMEESNDKNPLKATYEKLIMRCSFGIINAGRNSV